MKKIIFVSGIQIFPPESGGQLRSANLARALARLGNKVEIYSLTGRKKDYLKGKKSAEENISTNLSEYTNRHLFYGIVQKLFYFLNLPPLWINALTSVYLPRTLRNKIQSGDVLLVDFPFLHGLKKLTTAPFVINTHNAEFELWKKSPLLSKFVKAIEVKGFKKADLVFFCHKNDMKKFTPELGDLNAKSLIVPNGLEVEDYKLKMEERKRIRHELGISDEETVFLFTGSKYGPNQSAFEFLRRWSIENQFYLRSHKMIILIAGSVYNKLIDEPNFKTVGIVKEILPYFWASDFGLNPIQNGSGTNLKMMEYLASELPILSTPFGSRGLDLINDQTFLEFEPETLLPVMIKAKTLSGIEKKKISERAFKENRKHLDMSYPLQGLSLQ